jgi:hypothetical protein
VHVAAPTTGPDVGVTTLTKTRRTPTPITLACPRGDVFLDAEALAAVPVADAAIAASLHGARVRTALGPRHRLVSLQVTCRAQNAPVVNQAASASAPPARTTSPPARAALGGLRRPRQRHDQAPVSHRSSLSCGSFRRSAPAAQSGHVLVHASPGSYIELDCAGPDNICRWGDYAAASPEPVLASTGS